MKFHNKAHDRTGWLIKVNDHARHNGHVGRVLHIEARLVSIISLDGLRSVRHCLPGNLKVVNTPHWSRWHRADWRLYRKNAREFKKRMARQRRKELRPLFDKYNRLCKQGRYLPTKRTKKRVQPDFYS